MQLVILSGQLSCFISRAFDRLLKAQRNKHLRAHAATLALLDPPLYFIA